MQALLAGATPPIPAVTWEEGLACLPSYQRSSWRTTIAAYVLVCPRLSLRCARHALFRNRILRDAAQPAIPRPFSSMYASVVGLRAGSCADVPTALSSNLAAATAAAGLPSTPTSTPSTLEENMSQLVPAYAQLLLKQVWFLLWWGACKRCNRVLAMMGLLACCIVCYPRVP